MGRRKSFGRMTRWKSRRRIRTLCDYATRACCYQKGSSSFWFAKGFRFHASRTCAPGGTTHTPAPVDVRIGTTPQCPLSAPALPRRAAAERLDTPSSNPSRCALRSFVLGQAMVSLDPCCLVSNGARPHPQPRFRTCMSQDILCMRCLVLCGGACIDLEVIGLGHAWDEIVDKGIFLVQDLHCGARARHKHTHAHASIHTHRATHPHT